MRAIDLTGQRFGRLTVAAQAVNVGKKRAWWCACDCGNPAKVTTGNLRSGHTISCGCHASEVNSARATARNTVHGHNRAGTGNQSPTWTSWDSMLKRCRNPSHRSFKDYGGRGIHVCERWLSFPNFLADMGERPDGLTIERVNNDGNYEPGNCRWATRSEQQQNTRRTA